MQRRTFNLCLLSISALALISFILCAGKATLFYTCDYLTCPDKEPDWNTATAKLDGKVHYIKLSCNSEVMCFKGWYDDSSQHLSYYTTVPYKTGSSDNPCFQAEAGYAEPPQHTFDIYVNTTRYEKCDYYDFGKSLKTAFYFDGKLKETPFNVFGLILTIVAIIVIICAFFCLIYCAFGWVICGLYCAGCVTGITDGISKKFASIRKARKEKKREVMERRKQEEENRRIMEGLKNLKEEQSDDEKDD